MQNIKSLSPSASSTKQTTAVRDLITRVIGNQSSHLFSVSVIKDGEIDRFTLLSKGDILVISGNSGVAVSTGFYYYLKHYCGSHVSWAGRQILIPSILPKIINPINIKLNDKFRYYSNVCTTSYSMVWWAWPKWEEHIDWIAMSGLNMPLAFTAQEAIWQRVYKRLGFTQQELNEHFSGPAFLSWERMGNIRGWAGPLSAEWHSDQVQLQHLILDRMRSLGMLPVIPAFAGNVPSSFPKHFPGHKVSHLRNWNNFNSSYCCTLLLDAGDPMFAKIGHEFITEYISEFGSDHLYNADTFNEMQPASSSPAYISNIGRSIFAAMTSADVDAIWVMQGWIFEDKSFWKEEQAKALLLSVPLGRLIVLDLFSEVHPYYERYHQYYGQPYIWCMLHNFGGNIAMYGAIEALRLKPQEAREMRNSSMIGVGLTMEGIFQNDFIYEYMLENVLPSSDFRNSDKWFNIACIRLISAYNKVLNININQLDLQQKSMSCNYAFRRYGYDIYDLCKAWILLSIWYNVSDLFTVWDTFISVQSPIFQQNELFRYDLVDISRQSLQIIIIHYLNTFHEQYLSKDLDAAIQSGENLLSLINDVDTLLSSDGHFLLGNWLEDAKLASKGRSHDKILYEWNARNQITIWGPKGNIKDYANKQWGGLIKELEL